MTLTDHLSAYKNAILVLSVLAVASTSILLLVLLRLAQILPAPSSTTPQPPPPTPTTSSQPADPDISPAQTHLLIVLGSGGHTAEMLNILSSSLPDLPRRFTQRTYLVSSGDSFSAQKAAEFEETLGQSGQSTTYTIATVRRARRVHQSWLSTPWTTLLSLWDCIAVLRGTYMQHAYSRSKESSGGSSHSYPDLILTNGPGTGVCVVLAALILRFFGFGGEGTTGPPKSKSSVKRRKGAGQMRTIFIESWARVKTLSLSGRILRPLVNRFLVQWPQLARELGDGVEYIGPLVS